MCYGHYCGSCGILAKYSRYLVNSACDDVSSVSSEPCSSRDLINCPFCDIVTWHSSPMLSSFTVCQVGGNWLVVSLMTNAPASRPTPVRAMTNPTEPECDCQGCNYYR